MKLRVKVAILLSAEETERNLTLLHQLKAFHSGAHVSDMKDEDREFIDAIDDMHTRAQKVLKA